MARVGTRKRKPMVCEESSEEWEDSPEYNDSSSAYKTDDEEWTEGSTSSCRECFKRFVGREKQTAIGCDTDYCRRWYHRACIRDDFDVQGLTEKQIREKPFVCRYC